MLSKIERYNEILRLVNPEGKFSVSTVTIRDDLNSLDRKELVQRCRGGAIVFSNFAKMLKNYDDIASNEDTASRVDSNKFALVVVDLI